MFPPRRKICLISIYLNRMKKIYTLALAVAVAFSVSAAGTDVLRPLHKAFPAEKQALSENLLPVKSFKSVAKKAPANVTSESIAGDYWWEYYCPLGQTGSEERDLVTVYYSTQDPTLVGFGGLYNDVIIGTLNQETGTVSISPYKVDEPVTVQGQQCIIQIEVWDENFEPVDKAFEVTFNGNTVTASQDLVLAIAGYNATTGELLGYFNAVATPIITKDAWYDLGEATFVDGFMLNNIVKDNTETVTSQVLVQRSESDPNLIRIVNPWFGAFKKAWPGESDEDLQSPNLELNIGDPTYVTIDIQSIGLTAGTMGSVYVVSFNSVNFYADGLTPEQIKERFFASKDKDKNITLDGNDINFAPNAIAMIYENDAQQVYTQKNAMASKLTLPEGWADVNGIENVEVSNNAPVEYFNLQGVRVAVPENGIYIRRQGNKATKVIVK